jgi:ATP-dependent Zn protease
MSNRRNPNTSSRRKSAPKRRTAEELRQTAIHEAGHAVIHRVVGMVCGEATIVPDYKKMTAGFAIAEDPWVVYSAWERRGKLRGWHYESILRGRIMGYMAGREAEIIAFGSDAGGDDDDVRQIDLMAEDAEISIAYLERLRLKVGPLLRRHWRKVECVANALISHKTLSAAEIDALIDTVTSPDERARAARIDTARKPLRDELAWKWRGRDAQACG